MSEQQQQHSVNFTCDEVSGTCVLNKQTQEFLPGVTETVTSQTIQPAQVPELPQSAAPQVHQSASSPQAAQSAPPQAATPELFPNLLANHNTCRKFCALYEECLSTISETFPECHLTTQEYGRFMHQVKDKEEQEANMIKQWHKDMSASQFYTRADQHDNTLWINMPLFSRIDVSKKIQDPDMNPESIEIIWEYVDGMNRHARMYNAIPTKLFDNIQSQAMQYKDKIQNGELNLENMNWSDIQSMGEKLISSISQSDVTELTNNLSGLAQSYKIQNLDDIFKLVADIPGLGESTQNLNTDKVSNMIEQVMGGMGSSGDPKQSSSSSSSSSSAAQFQGLPQLSGVMAAFGQMMRASNGNSQKM